jgi:nitrite reductase (NADH) large subunit
MPGQSERKRLVLVGNGMASYKFCEKFQELGLDARYTLTVVGEEPHVAYDRVNLTQYYSGKSLRDLTLIQRHEYETQNVTLFNGSPVNRINRADKSIALGSGVEVPYDTLILATGSAPWLPDVKGIDTPGVFVYRTIEDIDTIKKYRRRARKAVVIGGGLLGLEAAKALVEDRLDTTVVEKAPCILPRQLDGRGAELLQRLLIQQGLKFVLGASVEEIVSNSHVTSMKLIGGVELDADMVIVAAGIRPRDELAKATGLTVGPNGGIWVDDRMQTSDSTVMAIGECAFALDQLWGLVKPCYEMAEVAACQLAGIEKRFGGNDITCTLNIIGVGVVSFGDALDASGSLNAFSVEAFSNGTYKRLNLSKDGKYLRGGMLIGDLSDYAYLYQLHHNQTEIDESPEALLQPAKSKAVPRTHSLWDMPDETRICQCEKVAKATIMQAIRENNITQVSEIQELTSAGTGCETCVPMLKSLLEEYHARVA